MRAISASGSRRCCPTAAVLHGLKRLRKDNTGYDLRHLLIGAEGHAGGHHRGEPEAGPPARRASARRCWWCERPQAALALLSLAQARLGGLISAFELIGTDGARVSGRDDAGGAPALADAPDWMVLIDVGLPDGLDPTTALAAPVARRRRAGAGAGRRDRRNRRPSGRISGICARRSPRRTAGSARCRATTSRCRWARWRTSSRRRARRWPGWATGGSTALAIWATATCITTFSRGRSQPRRP